MERLHGIHHLWHAVDRRARSERTLETKSELRFRHTHQISRQRDLRRRIQPDTRDDAILEQGTGQWTVNADVTLSDDAGGGYLPADDVLMRKAGNRALDGVALRPVSRPERGGQLREARPGAPVKP